MGTDQDPEKVTGTGRPGGRRYGGGSPRTVHRAERGSVSRSNMTRPAGLIFFNSRSEPGRSGACAPIQLTNVPSASATPSAVRTLKRLESRAPPYRRLLSRRGYGIILRPGPRKGDGNWPAGRPAVRRWRPPPKRFRVGNPPMAEIFSLITVLWGLKCLFR